MLKVKNEELYRYKSIEEERRMLEKEKKQAYIIAGLFTLSCIVLCMIQPLYSGDIDNYGMALVANKLFAGETQDGYILFLHPLLCALLSGVHTILPHADCFSLVGEVCVLIGIWWISFWLTWKAHCLWKIIVGNSGILVFVLIDDLFHANFTRWAVFLCTVGAIIWLMSVKTQEKKYQIIGLLFLIAGGMWRNVVSVLFLPFIMLVLIVYIASEAEAERRQRICTTMKSALILIAGVFLLIGSQSIVNAMPWYSYGSKFNQARSAILDYPVQDYWVVAEHLPDVSCNDYALIQHWFMADTDFMNLDRFQEIEGVASAVSYRLSLGNLKLILWTIKESFIQSQHLLILSSICALLGLLIMGYGNWWQRIAVVLFFMGDMIIFLFLVRQGRAIERSYYPPLYSTLCGLVALTYEGDWYSGKVAQILVRGVEIVVVVWCIEMGISNFRLELGQSVWTANVSQISEQSEEIRIWSCGSWVRNFVRDQYMEKGKLVPLSVMQENITDGNWFYGQRYFEQYLQQIGTDNPISLLLNQDAVYISDNPDLLLQYLREHYDAEAELIRVGEVQNVAAWKVK